MCKSGLPMPKTWIGLTIKLLRQLITHTAIRKRTFHPTAVTLTCALCWCRQWRRAGTDVGWSHRGARRLSRWPADNTWSVRSSTPDLIFASVRRRTPSPWCCCFFCGDTRVPSIYGVQRTSVKVGSDGDIKSFWDEAKVASRRFWIYDEELELVTCLATLRGDMHNPLLMAESLTADSFRGGLRTLLDEAATFVAGCSSKKKNENYTKRKWNSARLHVAKYFHQLSNMFPATAHLLLQILNSFNSQHQQSRKGMTSFRSENYICCWFTSVLDVFKKFIYWVPNLGFLLTREDTQFS